MLSLRSGSRQSPQRKQWLSWDQLAIKKASLASREVKLICLPSDSMGDRGHIKVIIEEEETLFNNITQLRHIRTISIIVHFVILSGNRMTVRISQKK